MNSYLDKRDKAASRRPLLSRPLDTLYFTFLVSHFLISVLIDMQPFYPPGILALFPKALLHVQADYLKSTGDPMVLSLLPGYKGRADEWAWFWALCVGLEGAVQVPSTLFGSIGLWRDSKKIWVVLVIYASTCAASLLPCLATLYYIPIKGTSEALPGLVSLSFEQKKLMLYGYLPFFVIPLLMTIDGSIRLWKAIPCADSIVVRRSKIE